MTDFNKSPGSSSGYNAPSSDPVETSSANNESNAPNKQARQQEIAARIVEVAKNGDSSEVDQYFHDILADGPTASPDRPAIFSALGIAQINGLIDKRMRGNMSLAEELRGKSFNAQAREETCAGDVNRPLSATANQNDNNVRPLIGRNPAAAIRNYSDVRPHASQAIRGIEAYEGESNAAFEGLKRVLISHDGKVRAESDEGHSQVKAISVAKERLRNEGYDAHIDLDEIIDDDVSADVSQKIIAAIRQAKRDGTPPTDAVINVFREKRQMNFDEAIEFSRRFISSFGNDMTRPHVESRNAGNISKEDLLRLNSRIFQLDPRRLDSDSAMQTYRSLTSMIEHSRSFAKKMIIINQQFLRDCASRADRFRSQSDDAMRPVHNRPNR